MNLRGIHSSRLWSQRLKWAVYLAPTVAFIIVIVHFNRSTPSFATNYNKHKLYNDIVVELPKPSPVYNISSKLETVSSAKKTPHEKLNYTQEYLKTISPDIFKRLPPRYLPNYRSFCWSEEDHLWCLPYFYIIGFHKCGTTDIFDKLELHPSVLKVAKEPHWWALRRAGLQREKYSLHNDLIQAVKHLPGASDVTSLAWYLNWFKYQRILSGVENTTQEMLSEKGEVMQYHPKVFGDGSVSTLTHVIFEPWDKLIPNGEDPEILPYLMHAVQPNAKIIITVRDPVARFRSMYDRKIGGDAASMHAFAVKAVECGTKCIAKHSIRYCAYFSHCQNLPQIYLGMYIAFIRPWAIIYGKENILVSKMEDRIQDPVPEFKKILQYLDLEMLPDEEFKRITEAKIFNENKGQKTVMLNKTKTLLETFYRPFNRKLAAFMNDERYNFGY